MDRLRAHPSFVEASQRLSDAQTQRCRLDRTFPRLPLLTSKLAGGSRDRKVAFQRWVLTNQLRGHPSLKKKKHALLVDHPNPKTAQNHSKPSLNTP